MNRSVASSAIRRSQSDGDATRRSSRVAGSCSSVPPTIWGADASYSMVFAPAYWVMIYWLAAYAARSGSWLPVAVVVLAASFALPVSTRWVLVGLVFVLLAEVLRRRTWP